MSAHAVESNIHIVDTNVILRFLLADHEAQFEQAAALLEKVRTGECRALIPESVLTECIYVLMKVYAVPRLEAAEKLQFLLAYHGIQGDHLPIMKVALELFMDSNVSIVDALLLATARAKGYTLVTYDKALLKLAAKHQ